MRYNFEETHRRGGCVLTYHFFNAVSPCSRRKYIQITFIFSFRRLFDYFSIFPLTVLVRTHCHRCSSEI